MMGLLNSLARVAMLFGAFASAAPAVQIRSAVLDDKVNATLEARAPWPKRGLPFNNPPNFIRNFNGGGSQVCQFTCHNCLLALLT